VFLSDMKEMDVKVGHGGFGKKGELGYGEKQRIVVKGIASPHGLSTHAAPKGSARVAYALGKAFRSLTTTAALNDSSPGCESPLMFKVVGDGKVLWASRPIQKKGDSQPCLVSVKGVDRLELVVDCAGGNGNAHAVWLEPRVER
jgi:alpha-galactosidase